jgi:hypothetical protein
MKLFRDDSLFLNNLQEKHQRQEMSNMTKVLRGFILFDHFKQTIERFA